MTDASQAVLEFLQTSSLASGVRDLVTSVDYVRGAGELYGEDVSESESTRLADPALSSKVLAVSVQDAGEKREIKGIFTQSIEVRILDKHGGYSRIRSARNEIKRVLSLPIKYTTLEGQRGFITLMYRGRSGYLYSDDFKVDFEVLTYQAAVVDEE